MFDISWIYSDTSKPEQSRKNQNSLELEGENITDEIRIAKLLNSGKFGDIFLGYSWKTGQQFAVKIIKPVSYPLFTNYVKKEHEIMTDILGNGNFPRSYHLTPQQNKLQKEVLLMDRLGPNLNEVSAFCAGMLTVTTISKLMIQMITRLEELHCCGYVHRDIKPENFCLGGPQLNDVYLVDFGLTIKYIDSYGKHIHNKPNRAFVGTPMFSSCNSHIGVTQSRRDDLEALGYIAINWANGFLPWGRKSFKSKYEMHRYFH